MFVCLWTLPLFQFVALFFITVNKDWLSTPVDFAVLSVACVCVCVFCLSCLSCVVCVVCVGVQWLPFYGAHSRIVLLKNLSLLLKKFS